MRSAPRPQTFFAGENRLNPDRFRQLQAALSGVGTLEGYTPEEIRLGREAADARGRELYDRSTRNGTNLTAQTPAQLLRLGAQDLAKAPAPAPANTLQGAEQQGRAGVSGFTDELSFGLADPALALGDAIGEAHDLSDFGDAYHRSMDQKRAADAYDLANYHTARTTGQVAGALTGIAMAGAPGLGRAVLPRALPGAARAIENANLIQRIEGSSTVGLNRMAAGGGAIAGIGSQAVSDAAHRHLSSPQDYAAAAGGGAAGGLAALRGGPAAGGAVASGAINAAQSLAHGQLPGFGAVDAAYKGAVFGRSTGAAAKYGTNALPIRAKGALGESLSNAKSAAAGRLPQNAHARVKLDGGGYTRPDHQLMPDSPDLLSFVEAKFGPWARLSARQQQAAKQFMERFRVDHWLPADVGQAIGAGFGAVFGP